jgi:hypothetical protein
MNKRSYNDQKARYSRPTDFLEEGLEVPFFNRPERNRQTNPIQSSSGDLGDILLSLQASFGLKAQGS